MKKNGRQKESRCKEEKEKSCSKEEEEESNKEKEEKSNKEKEEKEINLFKFHCLAVTVPNHQDGDSLFFLH